MTTYTVYFERKDNGEIVMVQEFDNHEEAVEVAEMFANDTIGYVIVEGYCR